MKKKMMMASLIAVAVTTATTVSAQKGFNLSVKAAPQLSFMLNEQETDNSRFERMTTFNTAFGVGAGYNFSPRHGLAVDVLYSLQGQKYKQDNVEYDQQVNYVKVPLLFTFSSDPRKPVSFLGKLGPQVSFLTSSKLSFNDGAEINGDTNDRYEATTIGGVANLGAQFRMSRKVFLTTGLRLDYDFSNAENKEHFQFPAGRSSTHNLTTGLEIGLKYSLR